VYNGVSYPDGVILDCNPTAYAKEEQLLRTVREQVKDLPRPLIVNCDDYKCHKMVVLLQACEQNGMYMYHTAGGLTPKFQIMDSAPNGIVHAHVTRENMLRMLTAKRDSRGYPVCMNRVELAHCVKAGWEKVSPGLIMRCAMRCGIATLSDFSEDIIERESLRSVRIDPIIQDLVCNSTTKFDFPSMQDGIEPDLYELGSLMGLDPEIHEDLQDLEDIRSAIDECAAAEQGINPDVMDIDEGVDSAPAPLLEHSAAELPVAESVGKRRRVHYSKAQLDVLEQEFLRGGARSRNEEIARTISCLDGAREVDKNDVRQWMANARRSHRARRASPL
jgi:hypothetical protein